MTPLAGKVAIVTGAARGIGLATTVRLAEAGAIVVVGIRDPGTSPAPEPAARLTAAGAEFLVAACDVADYDEVAALVRKTVDRFGRLDILVNNAGTIEPIGMIEDTDPTAWHRSLLVNLAGPYNAVRAALPHLRQHEAGVIVNVSSGAALRPREGWSAYCAGKAGLAMLTRSIHLECASQGVRVYGFQPGVVDTGMQTKIRASGINEVSRLRREDLAPPDDPAQVIAFLCGEDARDLAGEELSIRDPEIRRRAGLA
ncbi:MAG TPA: SDR family oxidoreductase [Arenibaculum sp.]|nr:SDR family oxidoreductase [Arenibaculum sp.]